MGGDDTKLIRKAENGAACLIPLKIVTILLLSALQM